MRIRQTLLAKRTMPVLYRVQRPYKLRIRNNQINQKVDSCSSESDTGKDIVKTQSTNNQLPCIWKQFYCGLVEWLDLGVSHEVADKALSKAVAGSVSNGSLAQLLKEQLGGCDLLGFYSSCHTTVHVICVAGTQWGRAKLVVPQFKSPECDFPPPSWGKDFPQLYWFVSTSLL